MISPIKSLLQAQGYGVSKRLATIQTFEFGIVRADVAGVVEIYD
jgi:hypothetical protein